MELYTTENEERLTDIGTVKSLLARHGFHFSKKLCQNFLINPSVCPRMAEACGADGRTGVLEIGPGIGVLTRELARRAARVTAIELDSRLLPILGETLATYPHAHVIHGDAMKMDLHRVIAEEFPGLRVAVCANLPYYITSPMLMNLLESRLPVENITVMVQKEAALRLCARPGTRECGAVTFAVRYYAEPEVLFPVSRGSFLPAPNVDSAVIRLTVRRKSPYPVTDEALLFRLVRAAFSQRRKTLVNALSGARWDKKTAAKILGEAGISETARAEQLTLEQFVALGNAAAESRKGKETGMENT